MHFTKMHGLGNDYLYVYGEVPPDIDVLCPRLSDRHFGAGSDGMIFIEQSEVADFKMRIFNEDGSEAKMCGNGIRCIGKYVYEKGYTNAKALTIETLSGIRRLDLHVENGHVESVTVDMGPAEAGEQQALSIDGEVFLYYPVSTGNPHAVIFTQDAEAVPLSGIGPKIEHHPAFPGGVNVEFVHSVRPQTIRMRVWERGSGITMACGTGACASAAAAVKSGLCRRNEPITVLLDGGSLSVLVTDKSVFMTGPATFVYEGETIEC